MPPDLPKPDPELLADFASQPQVQVYWQCDPNAWYLRYHPYAVIQCPQCRRCRYGRYDITHQF